MKPQKAYEEENTCAAAIIMAAQSRYAGALLEWAELWRRKSAAIPKMAKKESQRTKVTPVKSERNNGEQHQLFPS